MITVTELTPSKNMYDKVYHEKEFSNYIFLITGGAGFIGSNLVEYLLKYRAKHHFISDPVTTNEVNISGFLNMLVASRYNGVKNFLYTASSSTYVNDLQPSCRDERKGDLKHSLAIITRTSGRTFLWTRLGNCRKPVGK